MTNPHHPQSFQNKGGRELATGFSPLPTYLGLHKLNSTWQELHKLTITQPESQQNFTTR